MGRHPPARGRSGLALVELLVALTLLELAAVTLVVALVAARRHDRAARLRAAADLARRDTVAARAADATCRHAPAPAALPIALSLLPGRPAMVATVRCGR